MYYFGIRSFSLRKVQQLSTNIKIAKICNMISKHIHASLRVHTCPLSTHGFVCSLIMLACEQSGCYLNWRFINRPVYCCSRQSELTHSLTCTKKGQETHTHFTSFCQIYWSIFTEGCLCPSPLWICGFVLLLLLLFLAPFFHSLVLSLSPYYFSCFAQG